MCYSFFLAPAAEAGFIPEVHQAGLKACSTLRNHRGAEAPLFHVAAHVLVVLRKIKIKVKGVGQECPTPH